ncbi:hypothetical protein [Microbispora sp. ATCC PTA-5024]|nr:hypothetical protein [Microbispora sp. ATCC PTA-5024]
MRSSGARLVNRLPADAHWHRLALHNHADGVPGTRSIAAARE